MMPSSRILAKGIFTRPERVRKVHHDGVHYKLDALHISEPSPQRTPVLYQAGSSPAGRAFAARHAECVFISGPSKKVIGPRVAAIRKLASEAGREPGGYPDICYDDCHSRADRLRSSGQAGRLSPLCRPGRRTDTDVRLDGS